jgi:hypothetical protein
LAISSKRITIQIKKQLPNDVFTPLEAVFITTVKLRTYMIIQAETVIIQSVNGFIYGAKVTRLIKTNQDSRLNTCYLSL